IDLDGTLMDTAPDLALAANRMRRDFGLPALALERIAAFVGKGAEVLIHRALTDDMAGRVLEEQLARGRESFYRHYHAVNGDEAIVFPGVTEALGRLRQVGLKLACVTNKPREFTVPLLDRVGLAPWFEVVVAGDDVPAKKPAPDSLLAACEQLAVLPAAGLMIGDSANDWLAAQAAGMGCILVQTGYNEGDPVAALAGQPGLTAIVPSMSDAADRVAHLLHHDTVRALHRA
ncbi:MAG: phosphoglycolate phosphatase, partial [Burkholderiaceae bacterium]